MTISEVKGIARCRRDRVEQAYATGSLRACATNPGRKGRTPGVLFSDSEVLRWIASGSPTAPVGAL